MTDIAALHQELSALLGDRVTVSQAVREHHGTCEAWHNPALPDIVCFPETTEEVAAIVRACAASNTPVIPYGAGSSLEGQILALKGGVCISMNRMNAVLSVETADMLACVQAGVTRKQLNHYLRDTGLFFSVDPGADASVGGMCATRASGTNAVRYGTMRENVLGLTVVTPDGSIIKTGSRARKSAAGYDLTHLYIGSEGTLGVITEITVKLHGIPEATAAAVVSLPSLDAAVTAVIETIQIGLPIARIEILDTVLMNQINSWFKTDYAEQDTLFVEFHGTKAGVDEQVAVFRSIVDANGGGEFQWATLEEDRNRLWSARHNAYFAAVGAHPGKFAMTTDVCVPISKLAEAIAHIREEMQNSFLSSPVVGHVGDGNFHLIFCIDRNNPVEVAEAHRLNEVLVRNALAMGGTSTGEHGIGIGKIKYMEEEHGAGALAVMRAIKQALDPKGLFNPGKMLKN